MSDYERFKESVERRKREEQYLAARQRQLTAGTLNALAPSPDRRVVRVSTAILDAHPEIKTTADDDVILGPDGIYKVVPKTDDQPVSNRSGEPSGTGHLAEVVPLFPNAPVQAPTASVPTPVPVGDGRSTVVRIKVGGNEVRVSLRGDRPTVSRSVNPQTMIAVAIVVATIIVAGIILFLA